MSHLIYTNHVKLTERSEEELRNEMRIVQTISNNIKMEFGLEKCASFFEKRQGSYNGEWNERIRVDKSIQVFECRRDP